MATFFVDFQNGSDSNNGLGPDASHATNKPWKTIAKLLGASGMASGDTAYLSPASPFREVVTVAMTSATAETKIIGDVANSQGFKTSGGVLVAPGLVSWTAYLTTDTTAPSGTALLDLAGRDFLTFTDIMLIGGTAAAPAIVKATTTNSVNITFLRCSFLCGVAAQLVNYTGLADVAANWTIDTCTFMAFNNNACTFTLPTSTAADYDVNIQIVNCLFVQLNNNAVSVSASGANSFKPGGVDMLNCAYIGNGGAMLLTSANCSTSIPCTAYNNLTCAGSTVPISANASGQIIGDYNRRIGITTLTNVTAGVNDITGASYAPLLDMGVSWLAGMSGRPFLSPLPSSPTLGFGNQSGAPAIDFLGRPRPSGGGSAAVAAADSGTATAGAATTLTDSGKSWTTNTYAGYTVRLTGGTGSGQRRIVQSNTGTVLTISPAWTTNPDNTSTYTIDHSAKYAAAGYLERHDSMRVGSSLGADSGGYGEIVGPGDQEFQLPVDAASTTVSVKVKWDSNHGDTNKPQAQILNGGELGVADQTVTATGTAGSVYETLTFSAIAPTAKGIVTLRLISRAANGNGIAAFDTISIT